MVDAVAIGDARDRAFEDDGRTRLERHGAQHGGIRLATAGQPLEFAGMRQTDDALAPDGGKHRGLQRVGVEHDRQVGQPDDFAGEGVRAALRTESGTHDQRGGPLELRTEQRQTLGREAARGGLRPAHPDGLRGARRVGGRE